MIGTAVSSLDVQGDAASLADQLRPVILRLYRRLRREAQFLEVSPLDTTLLALIARHRGAGITELAAYERMRAPTMSCHVKRLEEAGLVRRSATSQEDRRRVSLEITPKGQEILSTVRKQHTDWLEKRLAVLPPEALRIIQSAIEPLGHLGD